VRWNNRGVNKLKRIQKLLGVIVLTVVMYTLIPSSYADPYCGGLELKTVQSGSVSGGLYVDTYLGFTGPANYSVNDKPRSDHVVVTFEDLPDNADVSWAQLYVLVYSGHMQEKSST